MGIENKDEKLVIQKWALGKFHELMVKYNRRAAKLKIEPIEFTYEVIGDIVEIEWKGEPLKVSGWEFVGTIQHENNINLLRSTPKHEIPESYREVKPKCEHCNHKRHRKDTFVLHNGEKYMQVGRNCLRDFIGHNPDLQIRLLDVIWEINDSESYSGGPLMTSLEDYLNMVAAITLVEGFDREICHSAWEYLFPSPIFKAQVEAGKFPDIKVSDESLVLMNKSLNWLNTTEESNGFIINLKALTKLDVVTHREIKLASWIIGGYLKNKESELMKQKQKEAKDEKNAHFKASKHIGDIGERVEREFTLISNRVIHGEYYDCNLVKLLDSEGNVFTWFASNCPQFPEEGTFKAKATVKKHNEYEGIKETVVNRLKITSSQREAEEK